MLSHSVIRAAVAITGLLNVNRMDRLSLTFLGLKTDTRLDGMMFFTVARQWTLSERLYERAAVEFPMFVHWYVTNVGTTSIDTRQDYFEDVEQSDEEVRDSQFTKCIQTLFWPHFFPTRWQSGIALDSRPDSNSVADTWGTAQFT